tara:strand:+ start:6886 stop:7119 length:234 start_codon:yes stop_codon:yes gene_type:complete
MPVYDFKNIKTDEVVTHYLTIKERSEFLDENPDYKQLLCAPPMGDSVRLGVRRHDDNFNDVLKNVKSHHRGSNIQTR